VISARDAIRPYRPVGIAVHAAVSDRVLHQVGNKLAPVVCPSVLGNAFFGGFTLDGDLWLHRRWSNDNGVFSEAFFLAIRRTVLENEQ